MDLEERLEQLEALDWMEQLRKRLYEMTPSIVLPPPRTDADIARLRQIAAEHGLALEPWQLAEMQDAGVFGGVATEHLVGLNEDTAISAMLQPRYIGDCLHTHDCFEIVCVCRGPAQQTICDLTMDLNPGDVCIIAPQVQHDLNIFSDSVVIDVDIRRSSFDQSFFKLFAENDVLYQFFSEVLYGNGDHPYVLFRTGADMRVPALALDILEDCAHPMPYSAQYRFACVSMLFLHLLRCYSSQISVESTSSGQKTSIVPVLQYMQANCGHASRASVAKAFHYNETYFSRMIHKATGQSFSSLMADIRLRRARELLTGTDLSIGEIAGAVGFQSVSHFHRLFRARYGKSPGSYRKQSFRVSQGASVRK